MPMDYFIGKGEVKTEEEAAELFKKGEIDLVVVFGPEFANRIMHSQDASIQLLSDGSEPNQASVRVAYAQQVVAGFQKELAQQIAGAGKSGQQFNIRVNSRMLYNPQQRSEVNFDSGCCRHGNLADLLHDDFYCHCTGTGNGNPMEILLASPLPSIDIVLAKLVPYMIISLIDMATILCLSYFVMHVPMAGSLLVYVITAVIYIFTSLMLGLLISTVVNTQLAAMLISLLLIVPTIYLSGMVFAIESMPVAAQVVSNIVPGQMVHIRFA